ncbi:MAG: outer membrane beta-barrel protein [Bacteroidales bacterium]|nr:outer membrane beta-barrel protein [Bacteroidales bacterium]
MRHKRVFFATLLILASLLSFSQSFTGGLKLGFDISQVDGDRRGGYSAIFPTGCLYAKTSFGESQRASMSLGVSYIRKGSKEVKKNDAGEITSIFAIRLQYIEMPLTFSWQLEKFKIPRLVDYTFKNKLCIEAGVSYAYLLKAEVNEGQGFLDPPKAFFDYDCGMHLGLTYYIGEHFFLNYRFSYTFFFLPIRKHPGGQVYRLNRGVYNNVMIFTIGWEI